jgi:hypothetical protein
MTRQFPFVLLLRRYRDALLLIRHPLPREHEMQSAVSLSTYFLRLLEVFREFK